MAAPVAVELPVAEPTQVPSIAPLLREIGRGRDGSRSLDREQARALMGAMLDGSLPDLALGAALMALRMKGETAVEIEGFVAALETRCARIAVDTPCVVIPTYNGARLLPNLVPLLALLLAREGVPVLLHGQASEPAGVRSAKTRLAARVTTIDVLHELGIAASPDADAAADALRRRRIAYVTLAGVAPGLSALVALRRAFGVRNVGHTLAKLLRPVAAPSLLLSSYTHAEFGRLLAALFGATGANAMVQQGTEGEAVINPRRPQALQLWQRGRLLHELICDADPAELAPVDAAATAAFTRAVLAGERPVPPPLAAQCALICRGVAELTR
jgi:anthranilate phosphoribosyltransferase